MGPCSRFPPGIRRLEPARQRAAAEAERRPVEEDRQRPEAEVRRVPAAEAEVQRPIPQRLGAFRKYISELFDSAIAINDEDRQVVYYTFPAFARWALRKEETGTDKVAPIKTGAPIVDRAEEKPVENQDRKPVTIGLHAAQEGNCDRNKSQV